VSSSVDESSQSCNGTNGVVETPLPAMPSSIKPGNLKLWLPPEMASCSTAHPDEVMKKLTREEHSWTPCPGRAFNVRSGPNYASTGTKRPSEHSLYDVVAIDGYRSDQKLPHIGRVMLLPEDNEAAGLGLPPHLIINFMVPNYAPGIIGGKKSDGPGWNLVMQCRLSDEAREAIRKGEPSPAIELARRFMHPEEGRKLRKERLKCIFGTADVAEPGFNVLTRQLIQSYNFKPFLSKTASSFYNVPEKQYFEIDVDTHTWGNAALSGLNTFKSRMAKATLRAGIVIEAEEDGEMPEQMLAAAYLSYMDPTKAGFIPPEVAQYMLDDNDTAIGPLE